MSPRDFFDASVSWSSRVLKTDVLYLVRASFWSNLNSLIIAVFSLGLYTAYAHFLPKATYGTYQYLLSFFSIATAFTLTGMNAAVSRAVAQGYEGTIKASIPVQLKWGLLPFLGCAVGAAYYLFQHNITLAAGLLIIGIATPLLYAYNTYGSLFVGRKDFRRLTYFGLFFNVIYYGALVLTAAFSSSPILLLGVNLFVQVIVFYGLYRLVLRKEKLNDAVDPSALSYGVHLTFLSVFGSVAGQIGSIFAFHLLGPVALATYSFSSALPDRLSNISFKFLGNAALARFSQRTIEEIRSTLLHKMGIALIAGLLLAGIYVLIAPLFFMIFFPAYLSALPYSNLYAFGMVISAPYFLPSTALTALKRTKSLYALNMFSSVFQIICPVFGMLWYGLWGLIAGQMVALVFCMTFATILVFKAKS